MVKKIENNSKVKVHYSEWDRFYARGQSSKKSELRQRLLSCFCWLMMMRTMLLLLCPSRLCYSLLSLSSSVCETSWKSLHFNVNFSSNFAKLTQNIITFAWLFFFASQDIFWHFFHIWVKMWTGAHTFGAHNSLPQFRWNQQHWNAGLGGGTFLNL